MRVSAAAGMVLAITLLAWSYQAAPTSSANLPPPPTQPIAFSHKTHLAIGIKCSLCHTNPAPGKMMGFPPTATCMGCHRTIATNKPAIKKLAGFSKSKKQVPWARVYSVPGWVYWSHRPHLKAGIACSACHGQVAKMEVVHQVKDVTTMGGCTNCHQQHNATADCNSCHDQQSS